VKSKAFTLIELLIVVAIIAILAAIAVPNFLEAQTRSKVSRVKADFRSVATAIESYRVDENQYPHSCDIKGTGDWFAYCHLLTTPIAYMSRVPTDEFFDKDSDPYFRSFEFRSWPSADLYPDGIPDPLTRSVGGTPKTGIFKKWMLFSCGPDRDWELGPPETLPYEPFDIEDVYDPTNGTVTEGNIFRLGP
jgi:general secretion pathway protein G